MSDRNNIFLVLASRSPRRRQLLTEAGYRFEIHPADESVEETVDQHLPPIELVRESALRKAADVVARIHAGSLKPFSKAAPTTKPIVLGCDTVAECAGHILGKPVDRADARRMLELLRGNRHRVISGLCLWPLDRKEPSVEVASTTLIMDPINSEQLDEYLAGDAWQNKAGAFGYQDRTGWIHVAEGSESNVVGLPMELLERMLTNLD